MSAYYKTITPKQWALFVWMVDNCEKKQNNACKGCDMVEDCIKLYQHVSNICLSNKCLTEPERENHQPTKGNPCVESLGSGVGRAIRRYHRDTRLSEGLGV